ncbi:hypothetical protein LIER_29495 [Lithospermum erythrorhizon]|uniref:Uncharacterized protein n=1 Tax=Lithospermum erythrorhizon TaxID=34254 RepID=A0AAV3RN10_LITER
MAPPSPWSGPHLLLWASRGLKNQARILSPGHLVLPKSSKRPFLSYGRSPEDFVGSLLRDSPMALPTTTSQDLDDSQAPLDVMPLRSRMGPPLDVPPSQSSKSGVPIYTKGKSSKEPPTLEKVKAKIILELITDYQLRQIRNHYDIPDEVKTRIPLEGESVDTPSTKTEAPREGMPVRTFRDTTLFWEFLNYGLPLPVSGFVDDVLMTLDRALGQLMSFAWLVLTVFQVACLSVGVLPNMALYSVMYNAFPHEVCDQDVLIKARLTKGVDKFPDTTILELLSLKHSSGGCVMPHKVNFKAVTTATITIPDHTSALDIVISAQESSPIIPPPKASSSFGGEFFEALYSLPSGITITGKTVSRREEPTAFLLLKNCMLKEDMEGIMGYSSPSELHDAFSHFQLKSSLEESEQRSRDLRAQLNSSQQLLAALEKRLEYLSARPPSEVVIEKFKEGQNFQDLLIDNTVSIMKTFSLKVYAEFPSVLA